MFLGYFYRRRLWDPDTALILYQDQQQIGIFAGNELRGSARAIWVEPIQAHLFFLTIHSNEVDEALSFRLYDEVNSSVSSLNQILTFTPDGHPGSIESPIPFTNSVTNAEEQSLFTHFEVFPNPFSESATVVFGSTKRQNVRLLVYDLLGRSVIEKTINAVFGKNTIPLEFHSNSSGIYIIKLETSEGFVIQKVIHERE